LRQKHKKTIKKEGIMECAPQNALIIFLFWPGARFKQQSEGAGNTGMNFS
jgi:hypothetical protein